MGRIRSLVMAGDRRAGAVLRDAAWRLGELTAALVDMFNPRTVVVGGELVGLGDDVLASLRGVVYQEAMPSPPEIWSSPRMPGLQGSFSQPSDRPWN